MDAVALAQSLEASKDAGGTVSLQELQRQLSQRGLEELARVVRSLAGYVAPGKLDVEQTAPWF
jgi:hypothetical protein